MASAVTTAPGSHLLPLGFLVSPLGILGEAAIAPLAWPVGGHGAGLLSVFFRVLHSNFFLFLVEYYML